MDFRALLEPKKQASAKDKSKGKKSKNGSAGKSLLPLRVALLSLFWHFFAWWEYRCTPFCKEGMT